MSESKTGLKVFLSTHRAPDGQLLAAGQYGFWSQSLGSKDITMLSAPAIAHLGYNGYARLLHNLATARASY
jgi:hypothetical protein